MNVTKKLVAIIAALTLAAGTGSADDLPAPEGDVVLTVTGHIHEKNVEDSAVFDMAMLEALPSVVPMPRGKAKGRPGGAQPAPGAAPRAAPGGPSGSRPPAGGNAQPGAKR